MESMTSMDSAGSCDSVNSAFSDDSLEHLSPEERACLMFLEETIESLEAKEDSGFSTDEPEDHLAARMVTTSVGQSRMEDVPKYPYNDLVREPVTDHKPFGYLVPSPLILANSDSGMLPKAGLGVDAGPDPLPATSTCLIDLPPDRVDLVQQPINNIPDNKPCKGQQRTPADMLMIPPPTDFRDEPVEQEDLPGDREPSPPLPRRPLSQVDMVQLLMRTVSKDGTKSPIPTDDDQTCNGSNPPSPSEAQPTSPYEFDEPKHSPPAVAPKPKRLPSNIILKTHKGPIPSPVSSPDHSTSSSCTSPNDRILMDPQRVRMEALRKLGLLKDDEIDSAPTLSPSLHSTNLRRPWEPSTSLVSLSSADMPQSDVPKVQFSPSLKPKFSGECRERSCSDHIPTITRQSRPNSVGVKSATLERMGPGLSYMSRGQTSLDSSQDKALPSALGKGSLALLRQTRSRPTSLGNGKDFRAIQGDAPQTAAPVTAVTKAPEFGDGDKPVPAISSHKLPRSQGISVLITPRSKSGEDRREALRKLGLLKD